MILMETELDETEYPWVKQTPSCASLSILGVVETES